MMHTYKITKHTQEEMLFTASINTINQFNILQVLGHAYMLEPQLSLDLKLLLIELTITAWIHIH